MEVERYLHRFDNTDEYNYYRKYEYNEPFVSETEKIYGTDEKVHFNKGDDELLNKPLTFVIQTDGDIRWRNYVSNTSATTSITQIQKTIEYRKNGGEWTNVTSDSGGSAPSISVVSGDVLEFRGNNAAYGNSSGYCTFSGSTAKFKAEGNIMSLINGETYPTLKAFTANNALYAMFYCATGLTSAEFLILPAMTLTNNCYNYTFGYCTAMQRGPKVLPADTLKNYCYSYMYYCCYALLTAPIICATTLANYCMEYMFRKCTSLTKGPVLLAPTLKTNCYRYMFYQSSKVNYVKCLATTVTGTTNWLNGASSTGTFVAARSDVAWSSGVGGIPTGWTRENIIEVETT